MPRAAPSRRQTPPSFAAAVVPAALCRVALTSAALSLVLWAPVLGGCTAGRVETGIDAGGGIDASNRFDGDITGRDVGPGGGDTGTGTDGGGGIDSGPIGRREIDCTDGFDGDGDGDADCMDSDCDGALCDATRRCIDLSCGGCTGASVETACGDGRDEDCDGMTDCADSDCDTLICGPGDVSCAGGVCPCVSGFEERICGDGTDDDCDGLVDCVDPDCMGRDCGSAGEICREGMCICPGMGFSETLCDGADDDCSGVADDGCPNALTTCCAMNLPPVGNVLGGSPWSDACPTGAALVGIAGLSSTRVDMIQPICAALIFEVDEATTPEYTFSARRGALIHGATHGGTEGTAFEDVCPDNQVAIGMHGSADMDTRVSSVSVRCASVSIRRSGGFDWILVVAPTVTTTVRGGSAGDSYMADCGPSQILTGLTGRSNTAVEQLGFNCRQLRLSLR